MKYTFHIATILAGALAGSAMAQAPDASCALPSEPEGIPAALDAAITGPADKDRACMKALLIPEARMMFVSIAADGAPSYKLETLDDWIARVKARGHATLEEKQLKFHIERYGNIAHLWSSYALYSDGKQVARGINSIQAIKEAAGWRVTGIMVQAESATAPLPKEYLPSAGQGVSPKAAVRDGLQADRAAIERLHEQDRDATLSDSADQLAKLWDKDAVKFSIGRPAEIGAAVIYAGDKRWEMSSGRERTLCYDNEIQDLQIAGDWAFEWWYGSLKTSKDGKVSIGYGKGLRVMKRQSDGTWRFARVLSLIDPPASGASGVVLKHPCQ